MRKIFVGPNGLRTGWRVSIFVALVVGMAVLAGRLIGPALETKREEEWRAGLHGLVVWAITEGRKAARGVDKYLMGETHLR